RGSGLGDGALELDVVRAQHAAPDLGDVVHEVVDLHPGGQPIGAAREAEQAAHDPGGPIHLAGDGGGGGGRLRILAGAAQELGLHADRRERVVDFVGDAARDLAHGGELL